MQPDPVTAHHEAAHFIVHASIGSPKAPTLTIVPDLSSRCAGFYHPGDNSLQRGAGLEAVWVALGGLIAEWMYSPEATHPLDDFGESAEFGDSADMADVRFEVEKLVGGGDPAEFEIGRQFQHVRTLLRRRWRHVEEVAAKVLATPSGKLDAADLAPWLGGKLPQWSRFVSEFDCLWESRHAT